MRTHGYVFNPIAVHWCLAPDAPSGRPVIEVVVLEVTNTPWHERHCYVVDARPGPPDPHLPGPVAVGTVDRRGRLHAEIPKALHVSPFMPMGQTYRLTCTPPLDRTWLRLETFEPGGHRPSAPVFDVDTAVRLRPLTRRSVLAALLRRPFPTHRVWLGIHAHAVALVVARLPFFRHPGRSGPAPRAAGAERGGDVRGKVVR